MSNDKPQEKNTEVKKESVKLKKPVIQAGIERLPGAIIDVRPDQAKRLRAQGDAE